MLVTFGLHVLIRPFEAGQFLGRTDQAFAEFDQCVGDWQHGVRLSSLRWISRVIPLVCGLEPPVILAGLVTCELFRAVVEASSERYRLRSVRLPTDVGVNGAFLAKQRHAQPDTAGSCLRRRRLQVGLHVRHVEIEVTDAAGRPRSSVRLNLGALKLASLLGVRDVCAPARCLDLVIADILADALEDTGQRFRLGGWGLLRKSRPSR